MTPCVVLEANLKSQILVENQVLGPVTTTDGIIGKIISDLDYGFSFIAQSGERTEFIDPYDSQSLHLADGRRVIPITKELAQRSIATKEGTTR